VSAPDEILIVLTIHEMVLEDSPAYKALSKALEGVHKNGNLFIYDNSQQQQPVPATNLWTIYYFHDTSNPGVGHAYNQAFILAKKLQLKWMLLADQDTCFPSAILERYQQSVKSYPECSLFVPILRDRKGIVSPFKTGITSGKRLRKIVSGKKTLEELQAINSGLLIDVNMFEMAGGYNEQLQLDFSDFDFFRRLKKITDHLVVINAYCDHEHSSSEEISLSKAMSRFKIYLNASAIMGKDHSGFLFQCRAFARAIKLSLHYKSTQFIGSFLSRES
jgi:GT2 family glycosyltransferase